MEESGKAFEPVNKYQRRATATSMYADVTTERGTLYHI